jgi:putative intracellular protease/amidase
MVATLANVDRGLAETLAQQLGMETPKPLPKVLKSVAKPEVESSSALSLFARPGDGSIRTRRVAILVADGVDGEAAEALHAGLVGAGAVPRYVGVRLGTVTSDQGDELEVEVTLETMPSVLFDAVAVLGGKEAITTLGNVGQAVEFLMEQYRHAKPILALAEGADLLENAGVPAVLPSGKADPGVLIGRQKTAQSLLPDFIEAIARHRHVTALREICEALGLDPDQEDPGRGVVRHLGKALVEAMNLALSSGDAAAAELVACECVVLAETKDHLDWELLGKCAEQLGEPEAMTLKAAYARIETEEDQHLYHSRGWCRELWIQALGMRAVLPPPEEVRDVKTAIGAAKAEQAADKLRGS